MASVTTVTNPTKGALAADTAWVGASKITINANKTGIKFTNAAGEVTNVGDTGAVTFFAAPGTTYKVNAEAQTLQIKVGSAATWTTNATATMPDGISFSSQYTANVTVGAEDSGL